MSDTRAMLWIAALAALDPVVLVVGCEATTPTSAKSPGSAASPAATAAPAAEPLAVVTAPKTEPPEQIALGDDRKLRVAGGDPCEGGEVTGGGAAIAASSGGPGGASQGGAIGIGSIGTHGGGPGRATNPAKIAFGSPTVSTGLAKDIVVRIARRHVNELRFCYDKQLANHPALAGTLVLEFSIDDTGSVTAAAAHGVERALEACVADIMTHWTFPKPESSATVTVRLPITMAPP